MKDDVKIRYPKGEDIMVAYRKNGETVFLMTRREGTDDAFSVYRVMKDGSVERLARGKDPIELERKCHIT